jgi:hypothetical protein
MNVVTGSGGFGVTVGALEEGSVGESDWQPTEAASTRANSRRETFLKDCIPVLLKN